MYQIDKIAKGCALSLFFMFAIASLFAQSNDTGEVTGLITGADPQQPLSRVNVSVKGTDAGDATSDNGIFRIEALPAGTYTLIVSRIGHKSQTRDCTVSAGQTVQVNFALEIAPIMFDDIVIERTSLIGNKSRLFNIPGSAHYLDAKDLEKFEYNDIHRALQEIPGVNIQEEDGYGLRPNIGFRGTGVERSSKITVMEDGILQAPAPYSAPAAYYFPTVGRMQGIEVRKGSSQIKYGPYTTGGALNFISTPIPQGFKGSINLSAGQDKNRRIHATAGNASNYFGFVAETYQTRADGFKKLDGGGNTGFDKKDYMVKLKVNTSADANIYQQLSFKITQTDEVSNETYLGLTDADFAATPYRRYSASQNDVMNTEQQQFLVRHFIMPSNAVDLTTSFYRTDFRRNWYKLDRIRASQSGDRVRISQVLNDPLDYAAEYQITTGFTSSNSNALELNANNRKYYAWGVQSQLGWHFNAFRGAHTAEVAVRYHEDQIDRFQWVDLYRMEDGVMELTEPGRPGTESNRIGKAKVWAGYAQLNLNFGRLTAAPGIRYEDMVLTRDDFGKNDPDRTGTDLGSRINKVNVVIPGLGLDYKFSPVVSSFVGVHRGFAPPGSREGTEPEVSVNYEAGLRINQAALNLQTTVFFNDYSNLLGSDLLASGGEGSGDQFNGGEVKALGLEFSMSYDLGSAFSTRGVGIPLSLSYTYTKAEFQNTFASDYEPWGNIVAGDELPYLAKNQLFLGIGYERPRYALSLNAKYSSKMRTQAGQGDFVASLGTDTRLIFDASASMAISKANKLFVTVRNVTAEKYIAARRPAGIRPGLPRTLLVGIKTNF